MQRRRHPIPPYPSFTERLMSADARERGINITLSNPPPRRPLLLQPIQKPKSPPKKKRSRQGLVVLTLGDRPNAPVYDVLFDFGPSDPIGYGLLSSSSSRSSRRGRSSLIKNIAGYIKRLTSSD